MAKKHTEEALDGWVTVGLFLLPGLPLWFVWERFLTWSGGYHATIFGVVTLLQFASVVVLHRPVMKSLIKLCDEMDACARSEASATKTTGTRRKTHF